MNVREREIKANFNHIMLKLLENLSNGSTRHEQKPFANSLKPALFWPQSSFVALFWEIYWCDPDFYSKYLNYTQNIWVVIYSVSAVLYSLRFRTWLHFHLKFCVFRTIMIEKNKHFITTRSLLNWNMLFLAQVMAISNYRILVSWVVNIVELQEKVWFRLENGELLTYPLYFFNLYIMQGAVLEVFELITFER